MSLPRKLGGGGLPVQKPEKQSGRTRGRQADAIFPGRVVGLELTAITLFQDATHGRTSTP
eukprot:2031057-Heterocapsa_arctica.AAC.1